MSQAYRSGAEAVKTLYTYDEWLKEYNRRQSQRKIRQRAQHIYYMKQRLSGIVMAAIGIVAPLLINGDATVSFLTLPLGIFLLLTKEKVMTF